MRRQLGASLQWNSNPSEGERAGAAPRIQRQLFFRLWTSFTSM
jgi:hypothetical protein